MNKLCLTLMVGVALFVMLSGASYGYVKTVSYVEYVEIWEEYYGGRLYWTITNSSATELRILLKENYDENHNGQLDVNETYDFIKEIKSLLINHLIGTVKVNDVQPLHGWFNGKEVSAEDISGLTYLNASGNIVIKLRFSGVPEDVGNMNSVYLSAVPFAAAAKTAVENYSFHQKIIREHTEIGATLSSYEKFPNALLVRLVVGEYFHYSGGVPENEVIKRVSFDPLNSPLVLFIILVVSSRIATVIERKNYDKHIHEGSTYGRRKKMGRFILLFKIALAVLYLLASGYYIYMNGSYYILLCAAFVISVAVISEKLYSSQLPQEKKGILMIEDVYLLTKGGIMISHETRRLKPEVDEDVISGMLVAIQDFVRTSFKDEANVDLKTVEFGDKKIFLQRGNHLILAAVIRGKAGKYIQDRMKYVLNEIERKYQKVLENWEGDVEKFRGVREILRKIWE